MRLVSSSAIAVAVLAPLPAQDLLWRVEGLGGVIRRGAELYRFGDVNGDGWEDLLEMGAPPRLDRRLGGTRFS